MPSKRHISAVNFNRHSLVIRCTNTLFNRSEDHNMKLYFSVAIRNCNVEFKSQYFWICHNTKDSNTYPYICISESIGKDQEQVYYIIYINTN